MSSEADKLWEDLAVKLRKKQGFCPLTPEEAAAVYGDAPEPNRSRRDASKIVESATSDGEEEWTPVPERRLGTTTWSSTRPPRSRYQIHRNEGENTPETDKKRRRPEEKDAER